MRIIIFLLILFSCFSLSTSKEYDNENIKTYLASESDPSDEEIINYCINMIKTNPDYKRSASTYLDLFYGGETESNIAGALYFGDLDVTFDQVYGCNFYEFSFIANTMTFYKDSFYLINTFTDGPKGMYEEMAFFTLFNAAYGIKGEDYFRIEYFNCDTFCDGDIDYAPLPLMEQNILRIMNQNLTASLGDNYFEPEALVLYPKETFTVSKVENPDLSKSYTTYKFSENDDPNKNKYNYDDFGFLFKKYNRVPCDFYASFNNPTFIINADNVVSFEFILSQITARDLTEGDITDKIEVISNNYEPVNGKIKPGTYSFTVEVKDNSGNKSDKTFDIEVKDITPPVVEVNDIDIDYDKKMTKDELKGKFNITDNCDSADDITVTFIKEEYYNAPKHGAFDAALGSYDMTLRYTDTSGNYIDKSFKINVVDHKKPIITIKGPIISYTTEPLSINDIKKKIQAVDEYYGNLIVTLDNIDSYGTIKEIKEYSFIAHAVDGKDNEATIDFMVSLVDNDKPVIDYNTSYLIVIDENEKLTKEMILELLKSDIDLTNFKVLSIESDYLNSNSPNQESYSLSITGIDLLTQEEKTINAEIRIPKVTKENTIIKKEKNIIDFIKENTIFFYSMVLVTTVSLISITLILIKSLKKSKKDI